MRKHQRIRGVEKAKVFATVYMISVAFTREVDLLNNK